MMRFLYYGFHADNVVIDSDVASEIDRLRREGMGLSEALNLLARRGMTRGPSSTTVKYKHRTSRIGLKVDVNEHRRRARSA